VSSVFGKNFLFFFDVFFGAENVEAFCCGKNWPVRPAPASQ
jgi:hypothetical protein